MPDCLDSYPWRSLKGFGTMAPKIFHIGDFKNIEMKNGVIVPVHIIGFNHDKTPDGRLCPITWESINCLNDRYSINRRDTNQGNWGGSDLFRQMNDDDGSIFRLFPDDLIEVVEPVVKLTAETYDRSNHITESVNRFFVLSEKEIFGRCIFSAPGEGHWYEWYKQEDVPYFKLRNGELEYRATRSPISSSSTNFCCVGGSGNAGYSSASYTIGVSFGFSF